MHSLLESFEQFIYPQYCNSCDTLLSEVEQVFCSKCSVNDIQFSKLGNWVWQLKRIKTWIMHIPLIGLVRLFKLTFII